LRNNALFPLGVDLVLVAGARVIALPRTTRIREG
jgi:alpha-D-ribose 1-methylphosphonate 5-triphosphate synthase subunit PhnH